MEAKNFTILRSKSHVARVGRNISDSHSGIMTIQEGTLTLINGKLEAGRFMIDSNSLKIADITGTDTDVKFVTNLSLDDALSAEKLPVTVFDIISAFPKTDVIYHIEGNLTTKGITKFISFDATINISGDTLNATARLSVDRKKYKMSFYPGRFFKYIKDTLINNNIDLEVTLCAEVL